MMVPALRVRGVMLGVGTAAADVDEQVDVRIGAWFSRRENALDGAACVRFNLSET